MSKHLHLPMPAAVWVPRAGPFPFTGALATNVGNSRQSGAADSLFRRNKAHCMYKPTSSEWRARPRLAKTAMNLHHPRGRARRRHAGKNAAPCSCVHNGLFQLRLHERLCALLRGISTDRRAADAGVLAPTVSAPAAGGGRPLSAADVTHFTYREVIIINSSLRSRAGLPRRRSLGGMWALPAAPFSTRQLATHDLSVCRPARPAHTVPNRPRPSPAPVSASAPPPAHQAHCRPLVECTGQRYELGEHAAARAETTPPCRASPVAAGTPCSGRRTPGTWPPWPPLVVIWASSGAGPLGNSPYRLGHRGSLGRPLSHRRFTT